MNPNDLLMIGMVVVLGGFMFLNGRKRKAQAAQLASKVATGAKIMLTSGIYGVVVSLDDNRAVIKSADSTLIEVDRRAIARVIENAPEKSAASTPKAAAKPAAKKPAVAKTAAKKPAAKK